MTPRRQRMMPVGSTSPSANTVLLSGRPSPSVSSSSFTRPVGPGVHGIARHLQHEPAAALVDVHGDRRLDVRLRRHQLDAEARVEPESRQRIGRRVRRAGGRRGLGEGGQREQDGDNTAHGRESYLTAETLRPN